MTYFLRRFLITVPVLFGVMTITFLLIHFVPGDPVEIMLGEQATSLDKAALTHELGLDLPLTLQYRNFFTGLLHLNLGRSLQSKRPVLDDIEERVPATLELTFAAMLLALSVGIPLGVFAAVQRHTWLDKAVTAWGLLGMSTPAFWLAPMLVLVFSFHWPFLPVSERGGLDHLLLPAITLASSLSSYLMQTTRASMLNIINEDYIRVARAKGLHPVPLYFKHALSNALMPVITVIGLQFGGLLTGTVIIETIFDWPGVGTLLFQAIQNRNYPVVQGCTLFIACTYVAVNLLTDLAYAAANPQLRLS